MRKPSTHILYFDVIVQIGHDIGGNFNTHIWACSGNFIIMPPTSKKLTGHIGFGLCMCASLRSSVRNMHAISYEPCMLGF